MDILEGSGRSHQLGISPAISGARIDQLICDCAGPTRLLRCTRSDHCSVGGAAVLKVGDDGLDGGCVTCGGPVVETGQLEEGTTGQLLG